MVDGPGADAFEGPVEDGDALVVPAVCLLEVVRFFRRKGGDADALAAAAFLRRGRLVPLDEGLALAAARLGLEHHLPLAASIVYATARRFAATLWTQDRDFEGLPGVELVPREAGP